MAIYRYPVLFQQIEHPAFDLLYDPGSLVPYPGIYRCRGCRREVALPEGQSLPSLDHHRHVAGQESMRWQLVVAQE
jgi:hypothetical protein